MQETNDFEDELEKLRRENKLKKKKLAEEHGANFISPSGETHLHPAMEGAFLDSVEQFEKAYNSAKRISVFDFIGRPEYRKVETVSNAEIGKVLDDMIDLLQKNQIGLDTLCEVEEKEIYRFITEELFLEKVDDMKIEGMMNCFIYEEFHPNHDYDIRNACSDFIELFIKKKPDLYESSLTKEAEENTRLKNFSNAFKSFSLHYFKITSLNFDELQATVCFDINFSGIIEGSHEKQNYSSHGKIELVYQYGFWYIKAVELPGISD